MQSIATWLEEQGGLPLYTVEGDEPAQQAAEWSLPGMQQAAAAAASTQQAPAAPSSAGGSPVPVHRAHSVSSDGSSCAPHRHCCPGFHLLC